MALLFNSIACAAFLIIIGLLPNSILSLDVFLGSLGALPIREVYGGEMARPHEFPWMAYIEIFYTRVGGNLYCSGTLVGSQWVLTAAHCVSYPDPRSCGWQNASRVTVHLGRHDLTNAESIFQQNQTSNQIFVHPDYDSETYNFDFALIKLSNPVRTTVAANPVAVTTLCQNNFPFPDGCLSATTAAGWGRTDLNMASNPLKKVYPGFRNTDTCSALINGTSNQFVNSKHCAGTNSAQDMCKVDAGGPLFCKDEHGQYLQIGTLSYGDPDCDDSIGAFPGVFGRICKVIPWIQSTTQFAVAPVSCAQASLPIIRNGVVEKTGRSSVGATRAVTCNSGFNLIGESAITCAPSGNWQVGSRTECLSPPPIIIVNGTAVTNSTTVARQPVALADCRRSRLPIIENGLVEQTGSAAVGAGRRIACFLGYSLVGNATVTCIGNGLWSQPQGQCLPQVRLLPFVPKPNKAKP